MTRHAILVLKPDAIASGLVPDILDLAAHYELNVACRHRRIVDTGTMVRALPETGNHVIERLLVERQYHGRPVEVLLVAGHDALGRAKALRAEARDRWARGPFANTVHAADEPAEWALQLRELAAGCRTCEIASGTVTTPYRRRKLPLTLPARLRDESLLRRLLTTWWDDPVSVVWNSEAARYPLVGSATSSHRVVLTENYSVVSVDGLTAAIMSVFPEVSLATALRVVLAAAHRREYVLTTADADRAAHIVRRLGDLGIRAYVSDPVARQDVTVPGPDHSSGAGPR